MHRRHSESTDAAVTHSRPRTHGLFRLLAVFALACTAAWTQNTPTVTGMQNLFDYSTNFCPGVLVVIYGANFATTVSSVTITVGGKTGYILPGGAATTELLAQIPFEVSPGPTTLIVSVNGTPSAPFPITLAATAPAFHTVDGSGSGPGVFDSAALALLTSAAPAKPGDTVVVLLTGLGATNPPTATGASPKAGNVPVATPTITVGGQPATIKAVVSSQYAGPSKSTSSCRTGCRAMHRSFSPPAAIQLAPKIPRIRSRFHYSALATSRTTLRSDRREQPRRVPSSAFLVTASAARARPWAFHPPLSKASR